MLMGMLVCVCLLSGLSTLSFTGNSYIEYRTYVKPTARGFKLDLRIRTFQSQGIIMYMNSEPCTLLKVRPTFTHTHTSNTHVIIGYL